jgi:hypothetical protein
MMLRNIAYSALVGTGLIIASVSVAGAWGFGFYPRAVPFYLYPIGGFSSDSQKLDDSPADKIEEASLNPICRPWPPFGYLCTASSGADETPTDQTDLNFAGGGWDMAAGDLIGVL